MLLRAIRNGMVCVACSVAPAAAEDIALSLVHRTGRIDIPARAIGRIEVAPSYVVTDPRSGKRIRSRTYAVFVCLPPDVREKICELTQRIVGEPVAIVTDCEILSEPVVREPICTSPCLSIPADSVQEARLFAGKLGKHPKRICAPGNIGAREPGVSIAVRSFRSLTE